MKIAVASGKGGTGKTTIATSLALSAAADREDVLLSSPPPLFLDCDAEAPNAHLYLKPSWEEHREVGVLIPQVDQSRCTYCGECAEVCQYHAIAVVNGNGVVFPNLCHGCGGCALACPEEAITEVPYPIGVVQAGTVARRFRFARGVLNVGEPMVVPIIRRLKRWAASGTAGTVIIDAPPGTSCPVVQSVRGANFLLLVTEPTPFGLHDLRLMASVAEELELPAGVVVNRDGIGDDGVDQFCADADLPILMRIPLDRRVAAGAARGQPLIEVLPEYVSRFRELYAVMAARVGQ